MATCTLNGDRFRTDDRTIAAMARGLLMEAGEQSTEQVATLLRYAHGIVVESRLRSVLQNGVRLGLLERSAPGRWRAVA